MCDSYVGASPEFHIKYYVFLFGFGAGKVPCFKQPSQVCVGTGKVPLWNFACCADEFGCYFLFGSKIMFVGCQWVFTTFVRFWKVLWVWSGFLGKVLEGMLVRVWEETIADIIVGKCSWVCSGSRFNLCSVVWEAHQRVWSGFLGRFIGDMIRRTWEETIADHPLQGIAVRIGFWNLDLEFWISEFWVLILGVWILEVLDCWFPSFVFGRFDGSEVVSLGRFWGRCLWESEGKPLQTLQSRKWSCFCPVFFGKIHGSEVVSLERFWRGCLWESGRKPKQTPLLGNALEFVLVPVSIFVWWFGRHIRVWSGFLVRFMGDVIRRTWEETIADHPLQGIAVRIGFWNLDLGFWISEFWFWILEFWFWRFGSWRFWIVCWFPAFVFGRFYGSEVVSLGRFWRRCLWESEGKPLQTLQSRKWFCFCPVFFGKIHGSEVVSLERFWRGSLWESGRKPLQTPLLGNALEFVLVPVSIFARWFGGTSRGLKWFPCEVYGRYD